MLLDADKPVRVIIVEVQLRKDDDKPFSWPAYLTVSRDQHRCQAGLLVVAPDPLVADWCAQPIEIGVPGFVLRPPVLRRDSVPVVTDPAEAVRRPELGVLSAMAHGETEQGATIAGAVLPAIQGLDDERARFYYDLLYNSLNDAARRALEAMMKGYEYQSDLAKKYVAQGRDEGRVEGAARALLSVLRARGIAVPTRHASASSPRGTRNASSAGSRKPPPRPRSPRCSTSRAEDERAPDAPPQSQAR
ncbi:hypothetical protein WME73_02315 [Sorangium sp. So ce302]|uniref:hypothetical protein n=1 Tax=Sorangium sp. So ce302 TaxID=3133297 RepID=UPI003F5EC52E